MDLSFFVIGSTTHLSGWNGIIHFSPHLASLSRSSCKLLLSDETVEKRKRLGPSTDPCGTPDSTYMMSDFSPSMTTRCVLSDRKPFIHAFVFPLIPYWSSLWIRRLWLTLSKAFEKSMMRQSVCCPLSRFRVTSSMNSTSWVSHDNFFLNLCCIL